MTDREKSDHWAELASVIGAEVPSEEREPEAVSAGTESSSPVVEQKAAPQPPRPAPAKRVAVPQRPAANWAQLAADLGIAPPPPPPAPPVPPAPLPTPQPFQRAWEPIVEELPRVFEPFDDDASFDDDIKEESPVAAREPVTVADEPVDDVDNASVDESADEGAEDSAEVAETPVVERRPGRRRRKRRRRSREPGEVRSEAATGEESKTEQVDEVCERAEEQEQGEAAVAESGESEPSERRPRRRRRRGASRRAEKGPREENAPEDRSQAAPPSDQEEDGIETGDLYDSDEFEDEDHEEGEEGEGKSERIGFRNIPTWDEAVGIIIAANVESRAKNPGDGRSQGGNRGRGGNRNSRRRPPDKRS